MRREKSDELYVNRAPVSHRCRLDWTPLAALQMDAMD
jgi:hypothetical protein